MLDDCLRSGCGAAGAVVRAWNVDIRTAWPAGQDHEEGEAVPGGPDRRGTMGTGGLLIEIIRRIAL